MAPEPYEPPRTVSLEIDVRLPDLARRELEHGSAIYAFARSGQLLEKIALAADGRARLQLPDLRVMQEVRVMVGPRTPTEDSTLPELSRRGAMEQFVRISPGIEPPVLYRGASVPMYDRRPVACFTYWDYQTGTEIGLIATADPTATEVASPARDAYAAPRVIAADGV